LDATFTPRAGDALIVVDMQYDFMPGGALPVAEGDAIVPLVNRLAAKFATVVLTQDWHPPGHASFASSHAGVKPFETISLPYGDQVLWPDHCVQKSRGAELHHGLDIGHALLVLRKGANRAVDSYSAFVEADGVSKTGLAGFLRERGVDRVFLCGLATDYCVGFSALDARTGGFEAVVVEDACRAIDLAGSLAAAWSKMNQAGVARVDVSRITS
jgi:nicotinamidase/pyrazinamidase